ncbi:MAG: glycerophosphodiester phosphodiesterase [Clostridiales bacterium]|nr:glycerophosphodiester phosphodiesterase [Clostridiales bacterium]
MAWIWICGAPALLLILYVFMTAPNPRKRARNLPMLYAHRGLHGPDVVENGLAAFERACRAKLGIEFDVRFTRDNRVVVFHDDALDRMFGSPERVDRLTLEELRAMELADGGAVPTLDEVLALVDGRVPLLIEIKNCRRIARLCAAVKEKLENYAGEYAVESFNPLALRWFRRRAGDVPRGQLVAHPEEYMGVTGAVGAFLLSNLLANCLSRPDFVAYDLNMAREFAIRVQRKIYRAKLAAWTVRTRSALNWLMRTGQSAIMEIEIGKDPISALEGERYV